jgi:hypothetical protein
MGEREGQMMCCAGHPLTGVWDIRQVLITLNIVCSSEMPRFHGGTLWKRHSIGEGEVR